ncbi:fluoride efflux transporter FluC [Halomonas sp. GD1P12]|uniref:fluoride efflux transporter FluC n=1 Tax=Halomonas sp. GD1P12 TaxID=2982691 RepID=UPI0021E4F873|nr:CrcB family protein [Halomonas sp. GD1P12]UYF99105.1 CrcB family protein [Halomonas sp. GD1P12]
MKGIAAYLAVGVGTALGSVCRYAVSLLALAGLGNALPWGTLLVNALGSALIGWLSTRMAQAPNSGLARWQPFWVTGFCAGFTTFSLFSLELLTLFKLHGWLAGAYALTSVALWLLGAGLGQRLAKAQG